MKINELTISGLRAFTDSKFTFLPGMNLLVGVNGVGKTTVLEALRVSLSKILPHITSSKSRKESFSIDDIKIGINVLNVLCEFEFDEVKYKLLIQQQPQKYKDKKTGKPRDHVIETPDLETFTPPLLDKFSEAKNSKSQPLGIFFSTNRSYALNKKSSAPPGQSAAFVDSLSTSREFNVRSIAEWYYAQENQPELPALKQYFKILCEAVHSFLPELQMTEVDASDFLVNKKGTLLRIRQLSDGERGMLSLVMELTKRLSQANPGLKNPLTEGQAIVLIDELDLHLHPSWQRTIVPNLSRTFPNCQFIATTHSPQIIPSVEPEQIQLIFSDKVIRPEKTKGMDTNWILKHLMETEERPHEAMKFIQAVENLIAEGEFEAARKKMLEFKDMRYDLPEWSMLEARIARLELMAKGE